LIKSSSFVNNTAISGNGGAIALIQAKAVAVTDSVFRQNVASSSFSYGSRGGAFYSDNSNLNVTRTDFFSNTAKVSYGETSSMYGYSGDGGALYALSSILYISKSNFTGNLAHSGQLDVGGGGGALYIETSAEIVITDNEFRLNGVLSVIGSSFYESSGQHACMHAYIYIY
jgi:hypothetical protein